MEALTLHLVLRTEGRWIESIARPTRDKRWRNAKDPSVSGFHLRCTVQWKGFRGWKLRGILGNSKSTPRITREIRKKEMIQD
jgi:hypothetical protein